MKNMYLTATEEKIKRIRFYKSVGKIVYSLIILTLIIILFIQLNTVMKMQADMLDQTNYIRQEVESIKDADIVARIEEKEPKTTTYDTQLTEKERDLVCRVVSAESRGEDLQGQMAVAQVIRDRSEFWDMPITEVVTAKGQFAKPYQGEISDSVKLAVENVFSGMSVLEEPVTHFYSGNNEPYWTSDKVNRGSIGRHSFWY